MIQDVKVEFKDILKCVIYIQFITLFFAGQLFIDRYRMENICLMIILSLVLALGYRKYCELSFHFDVTKSVFFVFTAYLAIISVNSYDFSKSITFLVRFIAYFVILFLVYSQDFYIRLFKLGKIYIFLLAISIIVLAIITGQKNGGFIGNYQYGATCMCIGLGLYIVDYYINKNSKALFFMAILFVALMSSGKRTMFLVPFVMLLLIFIIPSYKRQKGEFLILAYFLIIGLVIVYFTIPQAQLIINRLMATSADSTGSGRTFYWKAAIEIWKDNIWFGLKGLGNFVSFFESNFYKYSFMFGYNAHNIYIQLLAETGIIGAALMVSFFLSTLYKTIKMLRNKDVMSRKSLATILCISFYIQGWFLLYGFTGNPFYEDYQFFIYIAAIGMLKRVEMDMTCDLSSVGLLEAEALI